MSVISGKEGTVYTSGAEEQEVVGWKMDRMANVTKRATNKSGGFKRAIVGTKDWKGSFQMLDMPSFDEGDKVSAVFYDGLQYYYSGTIAIQQISENCDQDDGTEVEYDVTFEGDLAYTKSEGSAP